MARVEKTIFISYRRKDISWALAVYQYLTSQKYDVFFDYTSIPSGDFEQIIVSNIRARAHFVLILTPTALDRCSEPGDWLRREIETAIDERRNIIPLFFDGFNFGSPAVAEKLTGKLGAIQRYNGLDIPSGYFIEAMERLSSRYINIPLDAVLHPVSTEVRKVVKEEQIAVNNAIAQKWEDIKELLKPAEEKSAESGRTETATESSSPSSRRIRGNAQRNSLRFYGIGVAIVLLVILGIAGINALIQNSRENPALTLTSQVVTNTINVTSSMTASVATGTLESKTPVSTSTPEPTFTAVPPLDIGSTMISPTDGMTLVYVPAGEFTMGSVDGVSDESPIHKVSLDDFWIDRTEVTNHMFAQFLNQQGNQLEGGVTWLDSSDIHARIHLVGTAWMADSGYENHPVIEVSWYGAKAYCSWVDRRLPTEAEWEKAGSWDEKNQEKYVYPWGKNISCALANYGDCVGETTVVGSYPRGASTYGALDMAGNVWEWVGSLYQSYPYSRIDGREDLNAPGIRVLRGGSWSSSNMDIRSTSRRGIYSPMETGTWFGFRCAMDATE